MIRNPVVWGWDRLRDTAVAVGVAGRETGRAAAGAVPAVRSIGADDLRYALRRGVDDFWAHPTHYLFLTVLYPVVGLVVGRIVFGYGMLHLLFPLVAGFALLGPFAALGVYELSRRRELGLDVAWWHALDVFRTPRVGTLMRLGLTLTAIFVLWLIVASLLYQALLGPAPPASASAFIHTLFVTGRGWALIVIGNFVGFLFAALVLAISIVSFPMILDRGVTAETAMRTSIRVTRTSPRTVVLWGLTVAVALILGAIPLLFGLAVVLPVMGHATWHLYRRAVPL